MGVTIVTGLATAQINKVDPLNKNVKSFIWSFFFLVFVYLNQINL